MPSLRHTDSSRTLLHVAKSVEDVRVNMFNPFLTRQQR